jgi:hypothetical protein
MTTKKATSSKNPHNNHSVIFMSTFEHREQGSLTSEGVTEIRINSHLARKITWQHDTREPKRQHEWPPFAITIKESGRALRRPSAVFHTKTSPVSLWVAWTLSLLSSAKWGKVSSNSATVEATKFTGLHISHLRQYIINAYSNGAQLTWSLIDTGRGYHFQSSEDEKKTTLTPSIHIEPPSWEGAYCEQLLTTQLLPMSYITKHSHSIIQFPSWG